MKVAALAIALVLALPAGATARALRSTGSGPLSKRFPDTTSSGAAGATVGPLFSLLAPGSTETTECACPATLTAATGQAITTTRSTTGTCALADGTLVTCAANRPRVQSSGGNLAVLVEGPATNLALRSEEFESATWLKISAVVAVPTLTGTNNATALNGTLSAETVSFPAVASGSEQSYLTQSFATSASAYSLSVWLRNPTGSSTMPIRLHPGGSATCSVTTTWSRCKLENVAATAGTSYFTIGGWAAYSGATAAQTLEVWGAQAESGSYASSYTPTSNTAVTRGADTITAPNPLTASNPSAWCLGATLAPNGVWGGASRYYGSIGANSSINSANFNILTGRDPNFYVFDNASTYRGRAGSLVTANSTPHRLVGSNTAGAIALLIDGATTGTLDGLGTGIITTQPATLYLGATSAGAAQANGLLSNIQIDSSAAGCN